jgi:hypothetical protein
MTATLEETSSKFAVPASADEYWHGVHDVIIPFLDAVMSSARSYDECSTKIENMLYSKPTCNEECCDKLPHVWSISEVTAIQSIALAIGTPANASVLSSNKSADKVYNAILNLAEAIRDLQPTCEVIRSC